MCVRGVLDEKFGPWKEKGKKKLEGTNSNNTKSAATKENVIKKNNEGDKRKKIMSSKVIGTIHSAPFATSIMQVNA